MIKSKIKEVAEAQGIKSAYQLQRKTDLPPTMALRLWRGEVTRFSVETLEKLCEALHCQPGDLLTYQPEKKKQKNE